MLLKSNLTNKLTLLILLLVLVCLNKSNAEEVSVWGEFLPPLNGKPNDKNPGYMIEIFNYILEKNGHSLNYTVGPRIRAFEMVKAGRIDCLINAKINEDSFLKLPDEPWGYHAATVFARPESLFQYQNIDQLDNVDIGAIAGVNYDNGPLDSYLNKKAPNMLFSYGDNAMEAQVNTLLKKRVEVIVACPVLMRGQLKSMGLPFKALKTVGEVKPFVGMYLACGSDKPRTRNIIELINREVPLMRASGKLQTILDKYGQTDWIDLHQSLTKAH